MLTTIVAAIVILIVSGSITVVLWAAGRLRAIVEDEQPTETEWSESCLM